MIEKMKVVHIVAAQTQKTELLDALRALGIVHFAEKADADQTYLERFAALSRLITVLEEQGVSEVEAETLDDDQFKVLFDELNACLERKKALEAERAAAVSACDTLAGWGSFSPAEIKELKAQGVNVIVAVTHLGLPADRELARSVDDVDVIVYAVSNNGGYTIVITFHTHRLYGLNIEGWASPWQYFSMHYTITHWMPLPSTEGLK